MVRKIKASTAKTAVTKKVAKAAKTALPDHQLRDAVKDSAKHIWLAGLGAFAKAQGEGGKMFETLVKEGRSLQRKTQSLAEDKLNEVTGRMTAMADTVSAKAGKNWDKLETLFEARTARAMAKLGVPTAKDLASLARRVESLAAAVAELSGEAPAKKRAAAAGKTAAKKAAPKTARKTARKTAPVAAEVASEVAEVPAAEAPAAQAAPPARKTRARRSAPPAAD